MSNKSARKSTPKKSASRSAPGKSARKKKNARPRDSNTHQYKKPKEGNYKPVNRNYAATKSSQNDNRRESKLEQLANSGNFSGLEKRVNGNKLRDTKGKLVKELVKQGMSLRQAREYSEGVLAGLPKYKNYRHDWDLKNLKQRYKKLYGNTKITLTDRIKGLVYLARALLDQGNPHDDPYKAIDEGATDLLIPGWFRIHRNKKNFEKYSGMKIAYVPTNDLAAVHDLIQYAKRKHGKVNVLGFSDGATTIELYIKKYGTNDVNRFFAMGEKRPDIKSSKMVHIIGDQDHLASMVRGYPNANENTHVVYGGHTFFVYDKRTISEVARIVKNAPDSEAYNTTIPDPDMYRKAA